MSVDVASLAHGHGPHVQIYSARLGRIGEARRTTYYLLLTTDLFREAGRVEETIALYQRAINDGCCRRVLLP